MNEIICGDCLEVLKDIPDNSIDLIFTSPPYADQRKSTYGGVHPDKYAEWFLPRAEQLLRVLKPTGTFMLNIKEKVVNGERHTYVLELIVALRKQGWLWTEEFMWHKKNSYPGKWPNRFRDSWERLLQFNKQKHFATYQDEVMIPIGDWGTKRLANLSARDHARPNNNTGSGFSMKRANWSGREFVYPSNVLHLATESANKNHSAAFPETLPEWFIKLFTKEGDVVLDPLVGSGTTVVVAKRMGRRYLGIDISEEFTEVSRKRLNNVS